MGGCERQVKTDMESARLVAVIKKEILITISI